MLFLLWEANIFLHFAAPSFSFIVTFFQSNICSRCPRGAFLGNLMLSFHTQVFCTAPSSCPLCCSSQMGGSYWGGTQSARCETLQFVYLSHDLSQDRIQGVPGGLCPAGRCTIIQDPDLSSVTSLRVPLEWVVTVQLAFLFIYPPRTAVNMSEEGAGI